MLTLAKASTIGETDGSIIAAIIVTQMPMNQPRPPRSVPGPASIPRIRSTVTTQETSASARSSVAMLSGLSRSGERSAGWSCAGATAIGNNYNSVTLTMQGGESLAERYSRLAQEMPDRRRVDFELRALDLFLSSAFLVVSLPVAIPIGAALLVTSGRPVFYRGERVGRGGRVFTMTKFRTLRPGAEARLGHHLGAVLVERTEEEVTRMGRWLRATQLDEIPQFWNVLRGDMSLVGPRPIRPRFFEELAAELPAYWQRLVVRPGLTGFAQVRRGYETSMVEKLAHDLEWIADRSVRLYLRTLAATGWRVLRQSLHV